jgi:hypothetical protein
MSEATQTPRARYEDRKQRERWERETGVSIVWLPEPRPLSDVGRTLVHGVSTDADRWVLEQWLPATMRQAA